MTAQTMRRALLAGGGAALLSSALPARASRGTVFDRATIEIRPSPEGGPIAAAFNQSVRELSDAGGGTIRLGPGVFPTDRQLYILDNIRLLGSRQGPSVLRLVDHAPDFFNNAGIVRAKRDGVPPARRFVHNILLEHLTIDGNRANQRGDVYDAEKKYGFYSETRDATLRFVTVRDCMGYGFDPHGAIDNTPSERTVIEDCHAFGNLKDGFTLDRQLDCVFRRNLAENNDRAGVNVVTTTLRTRIEDNVIRDNGGTGISVQNGSGTLVISANEVAHNALEGVYLRESDNLLVSGNRIHGNGRAGIRVRGGHTIRIDENTVVENLVDPRAGQAEIHLDAYNGRGATGVLVIGNTIRATRNGALREVRGAPGNEIIENAFSSLADGIRIGPGNSVARDNVEQLF